ncbi:VOC family protein [Klenkia taihuensis]|uniref:Methylmalonyl-CoA epimerase n=1 Tax=Klenkia taihuensis TaxID=1225127 RepID=A0A1I1NW19_9ACTN|nr:VOC family protein [Klenkia taihuensis]GHE11645.1 methylmalonyl-CoA epimerase [Klenkia taihuensis]SFD01884.1 methylmalonyl-CoA epimerase [Klenkia taihuensis]
MPLDHVNGINIAVRDLPRWTRRYEQVLGVDSTPVDADGFAFPGMEGSSFDLGGFFLNLITSADPTTSVGRFLERNGDGFFLLSLGVDDVDAAGRRLTDQGLKPLLETAKEGPGHPPVNFLHPKEMAGIQIELIQVERQPAG